VQWLRLPRTRELATEVRADLFSGIIAVTADASRVDEVDWGDTLYRRELPVIVPTRLITVPYYLWNNRGIGTMMVWLPESQ
jgi:DUF1680 family protein